jgi:hypothetical protein
MIIIPANTISGGYEVANSLRFDDGSSDYLTRTPASASNRKTWTYSTWIKSNVLTGAHRLFTSYDGSTATNQSTISWGGGLDYRLQLYNAPSGSPTINLITNRIFRDLSAWYHVVVAVDTTQATGSNRAKIYINGVQETSFSTELYGSQNEDFWINSNQLHTIGRRQDNSQYFDGYMSEVCFIDGQQLTPTSFGEFDEDTNIWKPIDVSGLTFGTNGFYLDFENSGSLGADVSGNGNNFTVNNLTSIDQSTDTCTNNFATANPLDVPASNQPTFSNGNLTTAIGTSHRHGSISTFGITQGKWYHEAKLSASSNSGQLGAIYNRKRLTIDNYFAGQVSNSGISFNGNDGNVYVDGSATNVSTTFTTNDIIGVALDLDNNFCYFSKNGTFVNSGDPTSGSSGTGGFSITASSSTPDGAYFFTSAVGTPHSGTWELNFGSPAFTISSGNSDGNGYGNFEYAVPSGYYALNTKNLAEYG